MQAHKLKRPSRTVMFTDAALPKGVPRPAIIEYSFAEAPHFVLLGPSEPYEASSLADPSIHFRHMGRTNVAWCDGHASDEVMSFTKPTNVYQADNRRWQIGWFGPDDNGLFAPF
jgi:prepilin-type processing-associated H-X9-DG protein